MDSQVTISNLPMNKIFSIIPESYFPEETRKRIKSIQSGTGLFGIIALKELLEKEHPKAQFYLDRLAGVKLRGGEPCLAWEQTSAMDPSRVLKGKGHIIQTSLGLWGGDPDERHDQCLLNKCCDAILSFFRKQYARFDDILEWYMFEVAEKAYTLTTTPGFIGDRRFSVKHPLVKNLYFCGDSVTQWDVGASGAAHGAIICASAVSGKDYIKMLPPYMR